METTPVEPSTLQVKRALTAKEKAALQDIALKIWKGQPLSYDEFQLAKKGKLAGGEGWQHWQDFALMWYDDDKVQGYINISEGKNWGIPLEKLKMDQLTPFQRIILEKKGLLGKVPV